MTANAIPVILDVTCVHSNYEEIGQQTESTAEAEEELLDSRERLISEKLNVIAPVEPIVATMIGYQSDAVDNLRQAT